MNQEAVSSTLNYLYSKEPEYAEPEYLKLARRVKIDRNAGKLKGLIGYPEMKRKALIQGKVYKRCKGCGELKPLDKFYRDKRLKDGHRAQCKECKDHFRRENRKARNV